MDCPQMPIGVDHYRLRDGGLTPHLGWRGTIPPTPIPGEAAHVDGGDGAGTLGLRAAAWMRFSGARGITVSALHCENSREMKIVLWNRSMDV